ncbi:hypothetical protein PSHT_00746 [Puccinia striiformis]|uniref:Uncharacterized protein n=1 Tax=Puccinia striiformis TaxID=27350 RepID=A0A2S4WMA2_9BASI|nr:hypothetical protein PSHT_00746 [Puccinia striiformis]
MTERSTGKAEGVETDFEIKWHAPATNQWSNRVSDQQHQLPPMTVPRPKTTITQTIRIQPLMSLLKRWHAGQEEEDVDYESEIKEDLIIFGEEYVAELDRHKRAMDRLLEDRTAYLIAHDRHQSQNHNQLDVLLSAIDKLEDELDFKRSSTSENSKK